MVALVAVTGQIMTLKEFAALNEARKWFESLPIGTRIVPVASLEWDFSSN